MQGARMQERKNARLISTPYLPFIYVYPITIKTSGTDIINVPRIRHRSRSVVITEPVKEYSIPIDRTVTVKAVEDGVWQVISGDNCGVTGDLVVDGKHLYFEDGILIGVV